MCDPASCSSDLRRGCSEEKLKVMNLEAIRKTEFPSVVFFCFCFFFFKPALKPCVIQPTYEFEMFHYVFIICLKMGILKISFVLIT